MLELSRNTDPATSHEAGQLQYNNVNDRQLVLGTHYKNQDGLNDYELSDPYHRQQNSLGKRRTELFQAGLIEDSGLRRKGHTKSPCTVWRITEFGRTVYEQGLPLDNKALKGYAERNGYEDISCRADAREIQS
jgi:hypothetical protein